MLRCPLNLICIFKTVMIITKSCYSWCQIVYLVSISSMFFTQVFCTKFWRQKLRSRLLGLKFWHQKFHTNNAPIKHWWNWHLYLRLFILVGPFVKNNNYNNQYCDILLRKLKNRFIVISDVLFQCLQDADKISFAS